jgi:hypothetical protein
MYDFRRKLVPVFEGHQKSGFLTVLRSVSMLFARVTLMIALRPSFRYQQIRIQMFSITQVYIWYGLATCFGPDYDDNQAIVYEHFTFICKSCTQ